MAIAPTLARFQPADRPRPTPPAAARTDPRPPTAAEPTVTGRPCWRDRASRRRVARRRHRRGQRLPPGAGRARGSRRPDGDLADRLSEAVPQRQRPEAGRLDTELREQGAHGAAAAVAGCRPRPSARRRCRRATPRRRAPRRPASRSSRAARASAPCRPRPAPPTSSGPRPHRGGDPRLRAQQQRRRVAQRRARRSGRRSRRPPRRDVGPSSAASRRCSGCPGSGSRACGQPCARQAASMPGVLARAVVAEPPGPALLLAVLELVDGRTRAGEQPADGVELRRLRLVRGARDRELLVGEIVVALGERDGLDRLPGRAQERDERRGRRRPRRPRRRARPPRGRGGWPRRRRRA